MNDFLHKDRFRSLGVSSGGDPIGQGHYRLCMAYLDYLILGEVLCLELSAATNPSELRSCFPFMNYAARNWVAHASEAEIRGVALHQLLDHFERPSQSILRKWLEVLEIFAMYDSFSSRSARVTLLHVTAASNLLSAMRTLLEKEKDVDQRGIGGRTAPHYVLEVYHSFHKTRASNEACVRLLVEKGADIDARRFLFPTRTALSMTAADGNESVVRFLVEKGADLESKDESEKTPLQAAAGSGMNSLAVVRFLLESGADLNTVSRDGTALHWALKSENGTLARFLIERGAKVNQLSQGSATKFTILQLTVRYHGEEITSLLLVEGADVNARSRFGDTTLQLAVVREHQGMTRLLLANGADVDARGGDYATALQYAAECHSVGTGGGYGTFLELARKSKINSKAKVKLFKYKYGKLWIAKRGLMLEKSLRMVAKRCWDYCFRLMRNMMLEVENTTHCSSWQRCHKQRAREK